MNNMSVENEDLAIRLDANVYGNGAREITANISGIVVNSCVYLPEAC